MKEVGGVYSGTCKATGKRYFGSSIRCRSRVQRHIKELKLGKHANKFLQNAWNKYGEVSFAWELIEECPQERLLIREQKWINKFRTYDKKFGFNLTYPVKQKVAHHWASALTKAQWKNSAYKKLMTVKVSKTMRALCSAPEAVKRLKERSVNYWASGTAKAEAAVRMTKRWNALNQKAKAQQLRGFGPRKTTKWLEVNGSCRSLKYWAEKSGLPYGLLLTRLNKGCDLKIIFSDSYRHQTKQQFVEWLANKG